MAAALATFLLIKCRREQKSLLIVEEEDYTYGQEQGVPWKKEL
jgi:hypothetical protein